jgi:hypothetical protein
MANLLLLFFWWKQIEKCQYMKGIRICCSSWLNGVEIVKTKCKKYDETFLHVFFDQIDYAKVQFFFLWALLGKEATQPFNLTLKKKSINKNLWLSIFFSKKFHKIIKNFHKKSSVPWNSKINYTIHDTWDINFKFDVTLPKFIDNKSTRWEKKWKFKKKGGLKSKFNSYIPKMWKG